MNPVGTVNILVSTNRNNLDRFITTGEISSDKGSYIFSAKNTNFISLEHAIDETVGISLSWKIQNPDMGFLDTIVPKHVLDLLI